ncbi:MAG: gliding motility-associated ABC transporter substrate-binding protein GldG [Flavobacteriales bacterium]
MRIPSAIKPFFWQLFTVALVLVAAYVTNRQWDLTQDHRFTLGQATESILSEVRAPIHVEILLGDDVPSDFKRLKKEAKRLMQAMRRKNSNISLVQTAWSQPKKSEKTVAELKELGIFPIQLQVNKGDAQLRKRIFPWMVIAYANGKTAVPLLDDEGGIDPAEQLNRAAQELEYKLSRSIRRLTQENKPKIAFYHGEGETEGAKLLAAKKMLRAFYRVGDFAFRDTTAIRSQFDSLLHYKALLINNPKSAFSENSKYLIDQYIQYGGRVLWAVNAVAVSMDSLRARGKALAYIKGLNLTDLLFQYGVRINPVLVKDWQAAPIRVKIGNRGAFRYISWPYFPLVFPKGKHPIVRNIDAVRLIFPSDLDTLAAPDIKKIPLLWSSIHTTVQGVPDYVDLNSAQQASVGKSRMLAMALEGRFTSAYRYRVKPMSELPFRARSKPNKMLLFASGALFENETRGNLFFPVGYDAQTERAYGNDALLLNSLAWLTDDSGLIDLRAKHLTLRPLNREKIRAERWKWQCTNVGIPLLLLLALGALFAKYRRKKFGRQEL